MVAAQTDSAREGRRINNPASREKNKNALHLFQKNHGYMTPSLRFFVTAILISIFATLAILNSCLFVRRELLHRIPSSSLLPLVGGLIGCYAFSIAPWSLLSSRAWLPLFIDIGSLPWIAYCLCKVYWQHRRLK